MGAPIVPLDWDSAFFGFPIARVTATRVDEAALDAAAGACRAHGVRCAYLLLGADDARGSALAQAAGFVLRDVRVTLERSVPDAPAAAPASIAPARPEQHAALEALARAAFADAPTRFAADDGFPAERCRELYAAFLRRGLDGAPERVALASADARGFAVCHLEREQGRGTIELLAVAPEQRGRGLGGALVEASLAVFADAGLRRAAAVTQAANVGSQRIHQRSGFRTSDAALWFHRWF